MHDTEPVPDHTAGWPDGLAVGFIGAGRLARTLAMAFQAAGVRIAAVASRSGDSAHQLALTVPACEVGSADWVAGHCDVVFLTVPDAQIEPVAEALTWRSGQAAVHCSGATSLEALRSAARAGAWTGGFHPMQAFGDPQAALETLPGCTVAVEATSPLEAWLNALALRIGCIPLTLPPGARARYHAAGGYASQFIHVLLAEAVRIWQSWGATEDEAMAALLPLLRGTVQSLERRGLAPGMPGPVSRGDTDTIRAHRWALHGIDADTGDLYDQLAWRSVALARQAGKLDAARIKALSAVLHESVAK